jgi:hypothetical protein
LTISEVEGLADFRKELKALPGDLDRELTKVHKKIASDEAGRVQSNARSAGGVYELAARAIKGVGRSLDASVGISNTKTAPMGNVAFWGAKKHTGWYAAEKYADSEGRQHEPWVGSSWEPASKTEGPYVLNYTLAEDLDQIVESYSGMLDDLVDKAFPD